MPSFTWLTGAQLALEPRSSPTQELYDAVCHASMSSMEFLNLRPTRPLKSDAERWAHSSVERVQSFIKYSKN